MLLYHVTIDLSHRGFFTPRVPENIADYCDEDADTPRVCFSTSLEGALSAVPWGTYGLREELEYTNNLLKIYVIDSNLLDQSKIVPTERLMMEGLVPDSWATSEVWYLDNLDLRNFSHIIEVKDFEVVILQILSNIRRVSKAYSSEVSVVRNLVWRLVE